jgi:hypothetical protein
MSVLTLQEIKDRAFVFSKEWEGASREKAESQTFWNEFFNIFGLSRRRVATFEEPVKKLGENRGSIDLFWKGTLLVEHKSKGLNLDKAYTQALDYFPGIQEHELPQYVLVSDFESFQLYDLDKGDEYDFNLIDLPNQIHLFGFISGYKPRIYHDEDPVNIQVAEKMGELHDKLLDNGFDGHVLEIFLVRLIYCLFADDTGIFPKDHFHYFLETRTNSNGSDTGAILATIFQTLNRSSDYRQKSTDEELQQFPYVNGLLFDENLPIPLFTANMRNILLECCSFNWGRVSPAIFGSMFQAVMDKEKRRNLGAHYTSEKNILKVVRGLFLDELLQEFEKVKFDNNKLKQFHDRISHLRFFDPACGCGNFLIITYRELRKLEIKILYQLHHLSGVELIQLVTDVSEHLSKIDVDSMYGIELEEFPARIAEVALWLTDHQMNMELSRVFGHSILRLPLKKSPHIHHGNSLQMNWNLVVPRSSSADKTNIYILGNPPFVGKKARSIDQNRDMELVFGKTINYGNLDYVCCWYSKAAKFIANTNNQVAFVSTNSITQGEQVSLLWQHLLPYNLKINFAHRTFRWANEARGKAAVFCVILGFATFDKPSKQIFDYDEPDAEPLEIKAHQITPYLIDGDVSLIISRRKPICSVPELSFGNMPNDGGNLLFTEEEMETFLTKEPNAKKFVRPLISAHDFLHGKKRYCLWLINAEPDELKTMPEVIKRIESVHKYRASSKRAATRKLADYPYLFGEIRQPNSNFVLIPLHSSENRKYIPMAFFEKFNIVNNSCASLPNATLYHFGVLQSTMHMAWMRQICGRLEGRYRYSNNIVYNNFPWPENPSEAKIKQVEIAAQGVLESRNFFPNSTLSDLYDPNIMPKVLVDAHRELDRKVDSCYRSSNTNRSKSFKTELTRLEFLFDLYEYYTAPLAKTSKKKKKSNATTK